MSDPFLSTNEDDVNILSSRSSNPINSDPECIDKEENSNQEQQEQQQQINCLSELALVNSNSFVAVLKRLGFYWRRIIIQKIRVILTFLFMSMFNITTRIVCFTQQQTSTSSCDTSMPSSVIPSLDEDLNNLPNSSLLIENIHKQDTNLSSSQSPTMARILTQQKMRRTPSLSINRSTTSLNDTSILMGHSVDDILFYHDSTPFLQFLTRFDSESQISKNDSQSTNLNGHCHKSLGDFRISLPLSNSYFQLNESENGEMHIDNIVQFNCDKSQPVLNFATKKLNNDQMDDIISATNNVSEEIIQIPEKMDNTKVNGDSANLQVLEDSTSSSINDDQNSLSIEEDILIDTISLLNDTDGSGERPNRRRKRRTSFTKTSISLDDAQIATDVIEKVAPNNELSPIINENLKLAESDNKENRNTIEKDISENKESTQTIDDAEKSVPLIKYRGSRLKNRSHRHTIEVSLPQEIKPNISFEFCSSDQAHHIETPSIVISNSVNISDPLNLAVPSNHTLTLPTTTVGGLKRSSSGPSVKKNVHFADSVGLELTKVQYINSSLYDESKELSFLLDSSFLSSSPPSFIKSHVYLPTTSCLEHKPWSFGVAPKQNKQSIENKVLKRFYCLFRQPNSEQPDIYLHEVWKSQIKLEHADIPFKISSTGEQQLNGTLWVTNAGFQKEVSVKYTFNNWLNAYEYEAQHCCHSNDHRNIDQFRFSINIPKDVDRIDFVLRYCVNGQEYWDNNLGKNYTIQTDSTSTMSTSISLPHDCDFNEMRFY